jgi:Rap1a immunity proteins
MKRLMIALTLALVAFAPIAARADNLSRDQLLSWCNGSGGGKSGDVAMGFGYCFGYARGIADGLETWKAFSPETAKACIPDKITATELVSAIQQFSVTKMAALATDGSDMTIMAIISKWPCTKEQAQKNGRQR